jgi:sugar lactone lactonase YvrE
MVLPRPLRSLPPEGPLGSSGRPGGTAPAPAMEVLCAVRNQVGESPVWSVAEQALYWVDIEGRRVHRFDWASRAEQSWPVEERIGCIALHAHGGLLAAMESGLFHLRPNTDGTINSEPLHRITFPRDGMRFNDGRTDRAGRFWVTSMVRDMSLASGSGALYRCDARGLAAPLVTGLITGNGLAFSPDNGTMYLSDSHPNVQRIWAFDLDADGVPSKRREFVDMNLHPGRPDGAAVDAEGGYWICANDAGQVHRFTPDGRLDRSLRVPVSKPSMCAFGGPQLDQLFITSITPAPSSQSLDGAVFITRPGFTGIAETPFNP